MSLPSPIQEVHDHVPVLSIKENGDAEIYSLGESYGEMQRAVNIEDFSIPILWLLAAFISSQISWMTEQVEEFQYPYVDAWPLERDAFQFYDGELMTRFSVHRMTYQRFIL